MEKASGKKKLPQKWSWYARCQEEWKSVHIKVVNQIDHSNVLKVPMKNNGTSSLHCHILEMTMQASISFHIYTCHANDFSKHLTQAAHLAFTSLLNTKWEEKHDYLLPSVGYSRSVLFSILFSSQETGSTPDLHQKSQQLK